MVSIFLASVSSVLASEVEIFRKNGGEWNIIFIIFHFLSDDHGGHDDDDSHDDYDDDGDDDVPILDRRIPSCPLKWDILYRVQRYVVQSLQNKYKKALTSPSSAPSAPLSGPWNIILLEFLYLFYS